MEYQFIGGPLAGQRRQANGTKTYLVPDAADLIAKVRSDGSIGYVFGTHEYELKAAVIDGKYSEWYQWIGYFTPAGSSPTQATFHE